MIALVCTIGLAVTLVACERPAPTLPPPNFQETAAATAATTSATVTAVTGVTPVAATGVATATPTLPPAQTSAPATPIPTRTPTAIPTAAPVESATPPLTPGSNKITVKIFMIALEGGKPGNKLGCNDAVVAVDRIIPTTRAPLSAAYNELLSVHERIYGQSGLYNALYQSNLKVEDINIVNSKATVKLTGKVALGGTCDSPRFEAQLKETALQFATVKAVAIFINGVPLDQVLSTR